MIIQVQTEDFDVSEINRQLLGSRSDIGAITCFIGLVRDLPNSKLQQMTLEHYPGMTEKSLQAIAIIHRVGSLKPTDQIVLVSVLSAHRKDAFSACEFMMDYLKTDAPFWKKEVDEYGEKWVEAKTSDADARGQW
jgi:molybdopterin synthase catalytic subunit